jgi:uncharacterized protein YjbI with pentapeptide repeats/tetratricopeptide (TPR) repeat protein
MAVFTRQRIEANIAAGGAIRLMSEDLSELNLSGLKLEGASLEGANLWKADLREANLERADLRKADLHEANLRGANLSHACLDGANLCEANLRGAKLSGAKLRGASWPEANLEGAKLRRAKLGEVNLYSRTLCGVDLRQVNLNGANLSGINLQGVNLNGAKLRGANLTAAQFSGVDLRGADLTAAILHGAQLHEVDLTAAILDRADLRRADLKQVTLQGSWLRKTNCYQCDLREARLHKAHLSGANLCWARLDGADLGEVELDEALLEGATYDKQTQWPTGIEPSSRGAIIVADDRDHMPSRPQRTRGKWFVVLVTLAILILYFALPFDLSAHATLLARFMARFLEALYVGGGLLGILFALNAIFWDKEDRGTTTGIAAFFLTLATICFLLQIFLFPLTFTLLGQIILLLLLFILLFTWILMLGDTQTEKEEVLQPSENRFTEQAWNVLTFAQEEASRHHHNVLGTEHLLLGLLREDNGNVVQILRRLGVERLREAVEHVIGNGDHKIPAEIILTPRSRKVMALASDEARRLNHQQIGTTHILLGLINEGEGIAASILQVLDGSLERTKQETMDLLSRMDGDPVQTEKKEHSGSAFPTSNPAIQGATTVASSAEKTSQVMVTNSDRVTTKPWNIPFSRNCFFTGREDMLAALSSALYTDRPVAISQPQATSGFGGTGKTQLAIEYAYQHVHDYKAFLWVPAANAEALFSGLAALADLLELPERKEPDQNESVAAVEDWLRQHNRWLLILDNVDDLDLLPSFLLQTSRGHLLITTQVWGRQQGIQSIEIGALPGKHAALLLLHRAGLLAPDAPLKQARSEERALAFQLTQEMEGQPLALDQAGAYLAAAGMSLQEYRRMYQKQRQVLHRQRGAGVPHYPEPVITTWTLSFQQVEQHDRAAADLLRLCAFLAAEAIPEELFLQGAAHLGPELEPLADSYRLAQAVDTLHAYALLQRDPNTRLLFVHRQVQAMVLDDIGELESRLWVQRLILALDAAFPPIEQETWHASDRLMLHIMKCATHVQSWEHSPQELALLLFKAAKYLSNRKRNREAESLYLQALHIWEQAQGLDHPAQASSMCELADLFYQQRKYTEAEPLYRRVLRICEQAYGSDHLEVTHPLQRLAKLCFQQRKDEEAEPLYQRALQILEQVYDPDHPDVLSLLLDLSDLYWRKGNEVQSWILRMQIQERKHESVVYPLTSLAELYHKQKNYAEAEPLYQRAIQILEQVHGPDHYSVVPPLYELANLYYDQNKYLQAEPLYQRALHIREQSRGYWRPDVVSLLNTLASLYRMQGKYASAEPLYQRALRIQKRKSDPDHPEVTISLRGLAMVYRKQGRYTEAESLYQQALHTLEEAYGPDSPRVADLLNGLAINSFEMGNYAQAEPLYQRALHTLEEVYGPDSPDAAYPLDGLAELYHKQGNYAQAESLYQRVLHIWEGAYGPDHPDVAIQCMGWPNSITSKGIIPRRSRSTCGPCTSGKGRMARIIQMWPIQCMGWLTSIEIKASMSKQSRSTSEPCTSGSSNWALHILKQQRPFMISPFFRKFRKTIRKRFRFTNVPSPFANRCLGQSISRPGQPISVSLA